MESLKNENLDTHANGDVLGSGEKPIDQDTHEGGIETELHVERGKFCVSH